MSESLQYLGYTLPDSISLSDQRILVAGFGDFIKRAKTFGNCKLTETFGKPTSVTSYFSLRLKPQETETARYLLRYYPLSKEVCYVDQLGMKDPLYNVTKVRRGAHFTNVTGFSNDYKGRLRVLFADDHQGQFQAVFGKNGIMQIAKLGQKSSNEWEFDFSDDEYRLDAKYFTNEQTTNWIARVSKQSGKLLTDFQPQPARVMTDFRNITGFGFRDNLVWVESVNDCQRRTVMINPDNTLEYHRDNPLSIQYLFETLENEYFDQTI